MSRPCTAVFACTGPQEPILDESPMCIVLNWAMTLCQLDLIEMTNPTRDGFRQFALTNRGRYYAWPIEQERAI